MAQISQLKSLEIQGFKSFPDKTRLNFGQGITAVVGPNGSGKSNISDAVRWVLGEQSTKTLRSSKMEDVIFNGTVSRKSVGFAQVSLTIDNKNRSYDVDADEVVVTRRLYRSGDSEYRINNAQVRLKDIHELFMDTGLGRDGYSMVGQGKIAEIVSSKPTQRREIFEEAAGISKFRYKKEEAEKRLSSAEENMLRLLDILSQLEERVGPLEEQSKKAKRYLELAAVKKELEISLWIYRLGKSNLQMKQHEDKLFAVTADYEALQQRQDESEAKINALFEEMQQKTIAADNGRKTIAETEEQLGSLREKTAVLQNDIAHKSEQIERAEQQMTLLDESAIGLQLEDAQKAIDENNQKIAAITAQIAELAEKLSKSDTESRSTDEAAAAFNEQIGFLYSVLAQNRITLASRETAVEQLKAQLESFETVAAEKQTRYDAIDAEAKTCKGLLDAINEKLAELSNMETGYRMKIDSLSGKLDKRSQARFEAERAVSEAQQKITILQDLERNMDGFSGSVKAVIKQGKNGALRGIRGTVAQLIRVENKYATAIETALGAAMQNIVVENEAVAKAAIGYLKQNNIGRATFLPLTSVKGNLLSERDLEQNDGYIGVASELVDCDDTYRPILRSLLGRTALAEDLDDAVAMAKRYQYKFRIITLDGQVVNAGGAMTGGSAQRSAGILSRAGEIEKLTKKLETLQAQYNAALQDENAVKVELDKFRAQMDGLQAEQNTARQDLARYSAESAQLQKQLADIQQEMEADTQNRATAEAHVKKNEQDMQTLTASITQDEQKIKDMEAQLSAVSEQAARFVEEKQALSDAISEHNLSRLTAEKDGQLLEEKLRQLTLSQSDLQARREALTAEILADKGEIEAIQAQIGQLDTQMQTLRQTIEATNVAITTAQTERQQIEQQTVQLRAQEKELSAQRETLSGELARLEERKMSMQATYDKMIASLWDEYEMTRSQAEEVAKPVENEDACATELNSCKNKIRALGHVNVDAIEEYKEISERYTFLKAQLEDVEKSKTELKKLIAEVTEKMRKQFSEQFERINHNFKSIFTELFEGGSGELQLVEGDDILECGIDIKVHPPGKIIKNIAALSGGEQSLIAIAIYFAIMSVNPSPFCILDEIEAALDDVNVTRYANYLRRMSEKTQFIAITHRRGTMEEADVLYGVTMQEDGISKVLELNVSELESKIGKVN